MSKVVTIWEREDNGVWEYNHFSDGYDATQLVPTGNPAQTKSWAKAQWRKFEGIFDGIEVTEKSIAG